jgi:GcrA cell cycle regulator
MNWPEAHDKALKAALDAGCSFVQAAAEINAKFGTSYSRNAAIGRAGRMGLTQPTKVNPIPRPRAQRKGEATAIGIVERTRTRKAAPQFACDETGMRVADVVPLHLTLLELEPDMCRWPYGDGNFTFCGCPKFGDSSYCEPHDALATRPWIDKRRLAA